MFDPPIPVAAIYIYTLPTSIFLGEVRPVLPGSAQLAGLLAAGGVSLGVGLVAVGRVPLCGTAGGVASGGARGRATATGCGLILTGWVFSTRRTATRRQSDSLCDRRHIF